MRKVFADCTAFSLLALSVVWLQPAGAAPLEGDADAGKRKSAVCASCHGTDGNSVNPQWPNIAGQARRYFVEQLKAFKQGPDGPRQSDNAALMYPIVADLSEQDMLDLAAYFSKQEPSPGAADDEALARKGRAIYRGGNTDFKSAACIGCHGPAGRGNPPAGYPALAGQHAPYVYEQLRAFHDGRRTGDPNNTMQNMVRKMSDEEMRAVAEYVQGLH